MVSATEARMLRMQYTAEELAVLADLFELDSLPGVDVRRLGPEVRSLATRSLIARGIAVMPSDGGVEITQPHAGLIGTLLAASIVVQVIRHSPERSLASTWFDDDGVLVEVGPDDEGIVTVTLHDTGLDEGIRAAHGVEIGSSGNADSAARPTIVIEVVRMENDGPAVAVERTAYGRAPDGRWTEIG